tara:strand:+ start:2678 stop:2977 length:300 start_codon:yes stop_codon:yes gene_type:complete
MKSDEIILRGMGVVHWELKSNFSFENGRVEKEKKFSFSEEENIFLKSLATSFGQPFSKKNPEMIIKFIKNLNTDITNLSEIMMLSPQEKQDLWTKIAKN